MFDLYHRIWRASWRAQILLIVLSVAVAALAAVPLEYQKQIINGLAAHMEQHQLLVLGAQFLGILVLSAALKFGLGYRMSLVGEDAVRVIRDRLVLRQADPHVPDEEKPTERGTLATMIASEAEEVGRFVGGAIASPLMQLGTLVSVVAFIAANQPFLGLFILGIVAPQAVIVMVLQKQINVRVAQRVKILRRASDRVVREDLARAEAALRTEFDDIYAARKQIFLFKQTAKFALNAINGVGTAGILMLGGWFVLQGRADIGIVVAAVTGLGRMSQPWRELIAFYRELSVIRVRFQLLLPALPKPSDVAR